MKDDSKSEILLLSKEQKDAIRQGESQIAKGEYLTDAQVKKRASEWLGR
jgi:predicted transcriptional regulator